MDSNLDEIESRQTSLRRAYETANAQASSIVRFTLQWKELEEHIESTKKLVQTRFEEIRNREKEIGVMEKHLEAQDLKFKSERDSKAKDLHRIQRLIEEKQRGLDAKEKRFSEVEELIRDKEVEYGLIQKRIEERQRKLTSVEEKLSEQIRVKETQLKYVQGLVEKQWKEYDLNDERIRAMDTKEKDFGLLKKSMEEWATKLEVKERELQRWVEKLEGKQKDIGSKVDELNLIDKRVHECLKEVQLKEQQLYSLEKSLHAHSHGLQKKEKELELKQEQCDLDLSRKSMEIHVQNLKSKENSHHLKVEQLENIPPAANNGNRDGRGVQLLMNHHLRRNDLMLKEIEDILQGSPDPAKLVLDAMHGFYPSNSTVENKNKKFDLTVVRRSCNFLLRELKRVSPKVSPQVRGEASKLAAEWKAKMKTDNWLEVLGFLLLLAAYDLSSDYDMKELESFVGIVAQYYDTAELCPTLGIRGKAPDQGTPGQSTLKRNPSSISCSPDIKNEKADSPLVNIQRTTATNTDARNLQVFPNEDLSTGNQLIQNPVVSDSSGQSFVGLAGKVLAAGLIQDLIAKKQLLEAVVFSCNLRLTDMFPPVPLLKECVEGAIRNGSKVVDDQIFVLKAVIECIKDYNLESEFPSKDIELQLLKLERLKVDREAACVDIKLVKQQSQRKKRRKRDGSTYVSEFQPPQQQKKKHIKCYHCNEPGHVQSNCPLKC